LSALEIRSAIQRNVKVGRSLRFDVEALQRFIEQHTIETID
jgi:hypothetical protein